MSLVDTHAHLDFDSFELDRDEVVERAVKNGIEKIINIGTNVERSHKVVELAEKYENNYAVIGIHPTDAHDVNQNDSIEDIEALLPKSDKIVGIGETGLDYFHPDEGDEDRCKIVQAVHFKQHIELAQKNNLPVVIHVRDAYEDAYNILKKYAPIQGVMHTFAGTIEQAQKFIELGLYISFSGVITFKNAQAVRDVAAEVPLEKIVVETDCPFLTPDPHRGERNEPGYVRFVAEKVAEIKNLPISEVETQTTENAKKLFNLN